MAKKKRRGVKKRREARKKVSSGKKKEEMERGQVWSVDVLLALIIFISVILIFYTTMVVRHKPGIETLGDQAAELKIELEQNNELAFIREDVVDEERFNAFVNNVTQNYSAIKKKLGIKGDFCIFYEDAEGNIVVVSNNKTSIGNPEVYITDGTPCGSEVSIT